MHGPVVSGPNPMKRSCPFFSRRYLCGTFCEISPFEKGHDLFERLNGNARGTIAVPTPVNDTNSLLLQQKCFLVTIHVHSCIKKIWVFFQIHVFGLSIYGFLCRMMPHYHAQTQDHFIEIVWIPIGQTQGSYSRRRVG